MTCVRENNVVLVKVVCSNVRSCNIASECSLDCRDITREGAGDCRKVSVKNCRRSLDLLAELPALCCGPQDRLVGCTFEGDTAAGSCRVGGGSHRAELDVLVIDGQYGGVHGCGRAVDDQVTGDGEVLSNVQGTTNVRGNARRREVNLSCDVEDAVEVSRACNRDGSGDNGVLAEGAALDAENVGGEGEVTVVGEVTGCTGKHNTTGCE